jgi:hypothetical protein
MRNNWILGLCLLAFTQIASAAGDYVECVSAEDHAKFSMEFIGHPTQQKVVEVVIKDRDGKVKTTWHSPINGVARRGFIKISQTHQTASPFTRSVTTIVGMENNVEANESFAATYTETVSTPWTPQMKVASYRLSCSSPH